MCFVDDLISKKRRLACQVLNSVGGLQPLNMILFMLLEKLNGVDRKNFQVEHQLEHEIRLALNILINFMLYNNDDASVAREFIDSQFV